MHAKPHTGIHRTDSRGLLRLRASRARSTHKHSAPRPHTSPASSYRGAAVITTTGSRSQQTACRTRDDAASAAGPAAPGQEAAADLEHAVVQQGVWWGRARWTRGPPPAAARLLKTSFVRARHRDRGGAIHVRESARAGECRRGCGCGVGYVCRWMESPLHIQPQPKNQPKSIQINSFTFRSLKPHI